MSQHNKYNLVAENPQSTVVAEHEALADQLNQNPEAFWLLTYDNKKEIKSLYPERRIINFSLNYNAYESRKGREVMIMSDALVG